MPKIRIREKDMTVALDYAEGDDIVFLTDSGADATPELLVRGSTTSGYTKKTTIDKILMLGGKVLVCDTYEHAKGYLKDRNQFDVKFLLANEVTGEGELSAALEIATARRDCQVVYSKTNKTYSSAETTLLDDDLEVSGDAFLSAETGKAGKYCLPFVANTLTGCDDAGTGYILAYLWSKAQGNPEWLAVAGSKRGAIPEETDCGFLTESEIDSMQPTVGAAHSINPIVKMNPWGVRIWGNRTACPLEANKGLQASHFANIRVLCSKIKKALYKSARENQFEQNTDVLWVNFKTPVNSLLEQMVQTYGIAGYRWEREQTSERAKLKATLKIVPIEPVEDFDLTLELTDSLEVIE